eukprot:5127173-Prymnesium_polylepis.1
MAPPAHRVCSTTSEGETGAADALVDGIGPHTGCTASQAALSMCLDRAHLLLGARSPELRAVSRCLSLSRHRPPAPQHTLCVAMVWQWHGPSAGTGWVSFSGESRARLHVKASCGPSKGVRPYDNDQPSGDYETCQHPVAKSRVIYVTPCRARVAPVSRAC